ncbi:MAG: YicC family protein [Candidatus Omnitrophica bacterium]|nr:YicC family protein [Candidatus Omnitrophota bacterium]MBU4149905.1 YicC family protein [Candidatus Omnitrophota bacterium]
MIKSMTGFGKGETSSRLGRFTVEIRTVNHKYFDMSPRLPNSLNQLEDRIKTCVHQDIKRGKVSLTLSHKKGARNSDAAKIDEEAAARYHRMLKKLKTRFGLKDDIKLSHILSFPDVIVHEQQEHDVNSIWPVLEKAVRAAVIDCNRMREKEGKALYNDLSRRIARITSLVNEISKMTPGLVADYKRKLDSRIREILKNKLYPIDRSRLEIELAIFAKQSDVSEELTRAKSHLAALKETLASTSEAGRRLDFLLQELQREINTLGAKTSSAKISRMVIEIKGEMEKMREQAQNVE